MTCYLFEIALVQSTVNINEESNWLRIIVRKHRKTFHPIRHLLMIDFLGMSLEELFYVKQECKPFGIGPWPCLNAGAEHYNDSSLGAVGMRMMNTLK
ncbi:hypothetical protein CLTEP_26480 [Clostridium tepidiprofundi DSM 19306]|uniref:Transposon Tn7 transposition protein TnsD C-terminal domain-containing protein n=1 Tax=Clostridium tepidiprofundi DSM 19306 TaxID=1121338 RepID=A0A151AS68_9CLOT|nr:TnsD family Tn7-like transposition protein [Clostridium tepidiprofundi]KYH30455.1 hypothetical protein CLTEP_26480 [Clostridium tepidiprofundi DSM 19306]